MSNELPDAFADLRDLAEDMIDGLHDHGSTVGTPPNQGIKQWTETALGARFETWKTARTAHLAAGTAEDLVTAARKIANSNAKAFIATARRMLVDDFGGAPSRDWESAGWAPGTTAAPGTIDDRKKLLTTLVPWLGNHSDKEVPSKNFTAAKGQQTLDALAEALSDLPDKVRDRVAAAAALATAEKALRTGMSGLIAELDGILPDDSPDWYWFGLVPPAKAEPPAPPEHLVLEKAGPGTVIAGCDRSPRGQKYRFALKVEGRDLDWLQQPLVSEPQLVLEDLPTTGTLHVRAAAHNAAGDSPWSTETTLNL